jgi:hypothetical protein
MTWNAITVEYYQTIYPYIKDESLSDIERDCKVMSILLGNSEPELDRVALDQFYKLRKGLNFLDQERINRCASGRDKEGTLVDLMVSEAIKTSESGGEYLSRKYVTSSIKNNLGSNPNPELVMDNATEGISELMIDLRNTNQEFLSAETLFHWHRMLFKGPRELKLMARGSMKSPCQSSPVSWKNPVTNP